MRRVLIAFLLLLSVASTASALTVRDVIELSKAGLGDEVLLALIEVDRTVFTIDTPTLKMLKAAGVSQAVIVAMIRSGRMPVPEPPPPMEPAPLVTEQAAPPEPQVIVIDHHDEVPVAVPVAVPVLVSFPRTHVPTAGQPVVLVPGNDLSPRNSDLSPRTAPGSHPQCTTPVYWGFGGKLRPGSWEPPNTCR
jgi:hypothetical protein